MIIYTEKYTESEYDIQNDNLKYKIHQKCRNIFEGIVFSKFSKNRKTKKKEQFTIFFITYISSIIHILYFL